MLLNDIFQPISIYLPIKARYKGMGFQLNLKSMYNKCKVSKISQEKPLSVKVCTIKSKQIKTHFNIQKFWLNINKSYFLKGNTH